MTSDELRVDQGPGVIRRLLSRVRSSNELRTPPSSPIPIPNGNGKGNSNKSSNGFYSYDRSRGRTPSFKTPSFKVGSSNSSSSPPAGKKGSVSSPWPHPEAELSRQLWDEAYNALRFDPSTTSLVVTYESIISQELPDDLKVAVHATLSPPDGSTDRRMELMATIASAGLTKRRGSKTSQVDDTARQILDHSKRTVGAQLDDFPSAALAWAGICTLTPVCTEIYHEIISRLIL